MQYNKNYISIPHFVVIGGKKDGSTGVFTFDHNNKGMAWALFAVLKSANNMAYVHIMKRDGNYEETIQMDWIK
jgi:hypothetical protein